MKILLSAYACEPHKGSEPAVGWNWALELSNRGYQVWVITRANNKSAIEQYCKSHSISPNLQFVYYDLPKWARFWKKGRRFIHLYYLFWQWRAYRYAQSLHRDIGFDLVHHVTFVSVRQPSFMWKLKIPFIFGPLGGGDVVPWHLRKSFGWRDYLFDMLRDGMNCWVRYDPLMRAAFRHADQIIVTSEATKKRVPKCYWGKIKEQLAIGITSRDEEVLLPVRSVNYRLLFVGNFLSLKGIHLALKAFSLIVKRYPSAIFTLVGKGAEQERWKHLADTLGVSDHVRWVEWLPRVELLKIYDQYDLFLYPSLRDSGGMVVLEALTSGLPVVCLNLGGPGAIVDQYCGRVVNAVVSEDDLILQLAEAVFEVFNSITSGNQLNSGALMRAKEFTWKKIVNNIYNIEA